MMNSANESTKQELADATERVAIYEGRLSGRHWRQATRCARYCLGAAVPAYAIARILATSGFHPLGLLAAIALAGIGIAFAIVAVGLIRAYVEGQVHRQAIDERGVWAWNPLRPMFVPADRVLDLRPVRRFACPRVDVHVVYRRPGLEGGVDLWTDEGLTHEEFQALRRRLVASRST